MSMIFNWEQDYELIYITVPITNNSNKINVTTSSNYICVKIEGIVIIEGELYDDIYSNETNWYVDSGDLEITLSKVKREDCYGWWKKLLTCDNENRDTPDMRSLADFSDESQIKIKQMLSLC